MIAVTNSYFDGLSAHDGTLIIAHSGCVRIENGTLTTQRYPIVDEEAGVVLGLALFERKPGVAMRRNLSSEWFYMAQGKIRSIYASMYYPEQEAMAPNWAPFDGNWPVAPPAK